MKNFIDYYLELRDEVYNIKVITAVSISLKTKLIDKDRKGVSQNRISDLKNMSYNKLKNKINSREFFLISEAINQTLGVDVNQNNVGLDIDNYVNVDNKTQYYNIRDIEKAWNKNYNIWFKDGYNIESIFGEFIDELTLQ